MHNAARLEDAALISTVISIWFWLTMFETHQKHFGFRGSLKWNIRSVASKATK